MKITTGQYLNGMPAIDTYTIQLADGITLQLSTEQYQELCKCVSEKNGEDAAKIAESDKKYWNRNKDFGDLIKDIRNVFYEDLDHIFLRRLKIDENELDAVLDRGAKLLGFE